MNSKFRLYRLVSSTITMVPLITFFSVSCSKNNEQNPNDTKTTIREIIYHAGFTQSLSYKTINLSSFLYWHLGTFMIGGSVDDFGGDAFGILFFYNNNLARTYNFKIASNQLDKDLLKKMCERFDATYQDGGY